MKKKLTAVDYQSFTTKDTPLEERRRLGVGDVWMNAAKCLKCGDVLRSTNRHDSKTCSCGATSVDGGSWYCRRSGNPTDMENIIEPYTYVENNN